MKSTLTFIDDIRKFENSFLEFSIMGKKTLYILMYAQRVPKILYYCFQSNGIQRKISAYYIVYLINVLIQFYACCYVIKVQSKNKTTKKNWFIQFLPYIHRVVSSSTFSHKCNSSMYNNPTILNGFIIFVDCSINTHTVSE